MKISPVLFFCLLISIGHAAEVWRTFTDKLGRDLDASVVKVHETAVILKLKSNGRQVRIEFDKLSEKDVDFLKDFKTTANSEKTDDATLDEEPKTGRLYPRSKEEIRKTIREIKARPKPADISKDVHESTQELNIYRYLCGLDYEVKSDANFSSSAEDAAKACEKNGGLSHALGHSTEKCNLASGPGMAESVRMYIDDPGKNNREARGHRAWCLNPPMEKVGFGASGNYSAMWCMDRGGKSLRGSWSYPGKGLFPLDYMHGDAWSLYGAGVPDSADKVKIRIFKLSKRPDKPFSSSADIPGREIAVKHVSKASMNGINFEPEEPAKRGIYWVVAKGGGISESYLIEFF